MTQKLSFLLGALQVTILGGRGVTDKTGRDRTGQDRVRDERDRSDRGNKSDRTTSESGWGRPVTGKSGRGGPLTRPRPLFEDDHLCRDRVRVPMAPGDLLLVQRLCPTPYTKRVKVYSFDSESTNPPGHNESTIRYYGSERGSRQTNV